MALMLAWYFHLPPCASDFEVAQLARENLSLLLEAHARAGAKVGVAVTGCLLQRLQQSQPSVLASLREAIDCGLVEPIATTHFEVCAPLLPLAYLREQIESDANLKQRLLHARARIFWPGNLAWAPALGRLLPALGMGACVVHADHLRAARETQLWRWLSDESLQLKTAVVDTVWDEDLMRMRHRLACATGQWLELVTASNTIRQALSMGTAGAIHRAWDDGALDQLARRLQDIVSDDTVMQFSGDDGDRINPVSIHQYERLLRQVGRQLTVFGDASPSTAVLQLDFLPAFMPGGAEFWRDDVGVAYQSILDDLYRAVDAGRVDRSDVLPLQDVFPVFWKRVARAKWFHERAWQLLERAQSTGSSQAER